MSCINSLARRREAGLFAAAVEQVELAPPLFVIGHWRNGTTHLQNLLAQDSDNFAFPNTYQVVSPHTFLSTEETNSKRFAWLIPEKRPMDNVTQNFGTPQEDEFALCLMSLQSLYLGICFPHRDEYYERYLNFRGVPSTEVDAWKSAFKLFLRKLTYKYGRPLVLKSPPHTARIRLLLEMFPDARFVHIHRDPYRVFQSFRHYFDTATWHNYLQRPDEGRIDDRIIKLYTVMYDDFFAERHLIPPGHFHEVKFEDLERAPMNEMQLIYERLRLNGFDGFKPKLQRYVDSLAGYQTNEFAGLDRGLRARIGSAWRRNFEEWGYPV